MKTENKLVVIGWMGKGLGINADIPSYERTDDFPAWDTTPVKGCKKTILDCLNNGIDLAVRSMVRGQNPDPSKISITTVDTYLNAQVVKMVMAKDFDGASELGKLVADGTQGERFEKYFEFKGLDGSDV
jgi:hypothetical protein